MKDLKKSGLMAKKGLMLGSFNGREIRLGGQEHVFVEAPTRAGKGVGVVIPNLLDWHGSTVVLDVKHENYEKTAGYRQQELGQQVLLFDPLNNQCKSCRYNPLGYINRSDPIEVIAELQKIGQMLYPEPKDGETFWLDSARSAFMGIGAYIAAHDGQEGREELPFTIGEIYRQITRPNSKRHWHNIINERKGAAAGLSRQCRDAISDFVSSSDNTYSGIRQTLTSRINIWVNPFLDYATSASDFEIQELRERPISLYLGTSPDNIEVVAPLYNLLFQQILDITMRTLPEKGVSDIQVLLLMDEFARLGNALNLANAFSLAAGYGIRLMPVVQSRSQLRHTYGPDKADEIIANCGAELIFGVKEQKIADELSKRLGTYTFEAKSRNRKRWESFESSTSTSDQRRDLMNPDEIKKMHPDNMLLFRAGTPSIKARKLKYYESRKYSQRSEIPAPILPVLSLSEILSSEKGAAIAPPNDMEGGSVREWVERRFYESKASDFMPLEDRLLWLRDNMANTPDSEAERENASTVINDRSKYVAG
ncbi:type IV secretory system conjugative DNA transfer family protein [Alterisphingorhabdus coralli]|uniref:Type IV secretory system conjugative DNA transfer family protein n=1 Tax=Alterisphingorhabdus coralli TaxID=3071408 RepID=A0AA97FCX0_9SPHN|nr:type IV secretory system conjugative DNA transfer family protein [Parasphingorhabdus sp. SCSIO 66989]WOE76750.1 type IV secretory system conjugative DNA transfer family protein [Parasphingorhabdus sp. SCSIO 66989]